MKILVQRPTHISAVATVLLITKTFTMRERETHTERDRDRQTDRQRHRQTDKDRVRKNVNGERQTASFIY